MKKRYSEEQIVRILKESEAGMAARDVCRKHNVSESRRSTAGRSDTEGWTSRR